MTGPKTAERKDKANDPTVDNDLPHEDGSELEQADRVVEGYAQDQLDKAKTATRNRLEADRIGDATLEAEKANRKARKFPHMVEISVRAVGMVPVSSHTVDLSSLKPDDLKKIVSQLIDELKAQFD